MDDREPHPTAAVRELRRNKAVRDVPDGVPSFAVRPRVLSWAQEAAVAGWLLRPPSDFGFNAGSWTAAHVARLIRDRLGVRMPPDRLRAWLAGSGVLEPQSSGRVGECPPSQTPPAGRDAPRFLIAGGDGTLGTALQAAASRPEAVAVTSRRGGPGALRVDLGDDPDSWQMPAVVGTAVLCAAVTSIDACQKNPAGTRAVNVAATVEFARRVADRGGHCLFLSTNQVFDGSKPFRGEHEPPCPVTEYGRQKAEAEAELLAAGHTVLRLTKVFADAPPLFRAWKEQLAAGATIRPFSDMVFAPVPLRVAAEVIWQLAAAKPGGVFHLSANADIPYSGAAGRLAARMGVPADRVKPTAATVPAPRFTALAMPRLAARFIIPIPSALRTVDELIEDARHG